LIKDSYLSQQLYEGPEEIEIYQSLLTSHMRGCLEWD
jgi:hypothetical protein